MPHSGTIAVTTGRALEEFVRHSLLDNGYRESTNAKDRARDPRFQAQAELGDTIYGSQRSVDFLVSNPRLFPKGLAIECKWQQSGGSVDEKFPYLVLCIQKSKVPTIIILDGGGYKPGSLRWLKAQASRRGPLRAVWTMVEFQTAVNNGIFLRRPLVPAVRPRRSSR